MDKDFFRIKTKSYTCARHSKLKKEYHYEGMKELLEKPLNKKEQEEPEAEQKKKIVQKEHEFKQTKKHTLDKHFKNNKDLVLRNSAIIEALEDGYTQGEVEIYLLLWFLISLGKKNDWWFVA